MKYSTFEGKLVDTNEIGHQHLSNIYWYHKIINNWDPPETVLERLKGEFNGKILPYRPKVSFTDEIERLNSRGYISWEVIDGVKKGNIFYNGHVIGEVISVEDSRELIINQLLKNNLLEL